MSRLHLVDGTFELFRAHYARRPDHVAPNGQPIKATVGVVGSLLSLLHNDAEAVSHIAVAFDNPIESFRNDLFFGYKTGAGIDPILRDQFDLVEAAVSAIGVVVWSMRDHEADDALATGARRWVDRVDQVRIMTPDKDLGQCLDGERIVQIDRIRNKLIDEAAFRERRGIAPESMPDWLALVGDTADGIPGLPKFGEKTASKLLGAYGHLEHIPKLAKDWTVSVRGALGLAQTLQQGWDEALLYRRLATLVADVPLAESFDDLAWHGVPKAQLEALCTTLGADRLMERWG